MGESGDVQQGAEFGALQVKGDGPDVSDLTWDNVKNRFPGVVDESPKLNDVEEIKQPVVNTENHEVSAEQLSSDDTTKPLHLDETEAVTSAFGIGEMPPSPGNDMLIRLFEKGETVSLPVSPNGEPVTLRQDPQTKDFYLNGEKVDPSDSSRMDAVALTVGQMKEMLNSSTRR